MTSFSWQALLLSCRTLLHWLCEEVVYRCMWPVAHCDKIDTI